MALYQEDIVILPRVAYEFMEQLKNEEADVYKKIWINAHINAERLIKEIDSITTRASWVDGKYFIYWKEEDNRGDNDVSLKIDKQTGVIHWFSLRFDLRVTNQNCSFLEEMINICEQNNLVFEVKSKGIIEPNQLVSEELFESSPLKMLLTDPDQFLKETLDKPQNVHLKSQQREAMKIKVIQKIDKKYYLEFYSEWLEFRSVFRKWEDKIGILGVLIAILIYFFDAELKFFSIGFLVFGILMIYEFYSSKKKWMRSRLESNVTNESITMIFEDNEIQSNGPFVEMKGKWNFFKQAIKTEKGIFLIPENGISIYIQKKAFENQSDIERIIKKIKEN